MTSESCKSGVIVLEIKGVTVPAFKNRKRAIKLKSGKMRTLTDPKVAKRMDNIIQSIESQLFCAIRTNGSVTLTGQQARSWIASNTPEKDSRQWIPELHILSEDCERGEEGATIVIEKL